MNHLKLFFSSCYFSNAVSLIANEIFLFFRSISRLVRFTSTRFAGVCRRKAVPFYPTSTPNTVPRLETCGKTRSPRAKICIFGRILVPPPQPLVITLTEIPIYRPEELGKFFQRKPTTTTTQVAPVFDTGPECFKSYVHVPTIFLLRNTKLSRSFQGRSNIKNKCIRFAMTARCAVSAVGQFYCT